MLPITVHVPDHRVEEFYIQFGAFISDTPNPDAPTRLASGIVPTWIQGDEAHGLAQKLWEELSLPGTALLKVLTDEVKEETQYFTPDELASRFGHPGGKSSVAGVLGGIGKAIRRAGLPIYSTATGASWHYVWDWDRERYSMTPEVARILRRARHDRSTL